MIKRIVVGTDGSGHAQHAVTWAAGLAAQLDAEVLLVHIGEPFPAAIAFAGGYIPYVPQDVFNEEHTALEKRVATEFAAPLIESKVRWQARVLERQASRCIEEASRDFGAQLIVVGARGLNSVGELILGSTSHNLIRHAHLPVVVVPLAATVRKFRHSGSQVPVGA
jgi:nucleotide-binding universal stress UspA family protein